MNTKKPLFVYIATVLSMLIPSPGRFVYGIVLVIELNFVMLTGTLIAALIKKIKLEKLLSVGILFATICSAIFFKQITAVFYPEISLTLGFLFYLIPVSLLVIGYLFTNKEYTLAERLSFNMTDSLIISVAALLFFLFRDIVGYGTFSFFGAKHQIYEKLLFDSDKTRLASIFATIPGAMIMSAVVIYLIILAYRHIEKRSVK